MDPARVGHLGTWRDDGGGMTCESDHEGLKLPESWSGLAYVGVQVLGDVKLEMRNCECGSTLCVELEEDCEHEQR